MNMGKFLTLTSCVTTGQILGEITSKLDSCKSQAFSLFPVNPQLLSYTADLVTFRYFCSEIDSSLISK